MNTLLGCLRQSSFNKKRTSQTFLQHSQSALLIQSIFNVVICQMARLGIFVLPPYAGAPVFEPTLHQKVELY